MRKLPILGLAILLPIALLAAQLTLRDGTTYSGIFISGNSRSITFQDDTGQTRTIELSRVRSIDFGGRNDTSASRDRDRTDSYAGNRSSSNAPWTLPAGAQIAVRTNESIDSERATDGQTFSGVIAQDVNDANGNLLIPRGSDARLVIRNVATGGVTGSPTLALDLQSVQVNGQTYTVSTSDIQQSGDTGIGKNKRTAEMVGGGAVLGTLLGAIAGGGKGAAIGAVAGAAAGGTAQVLTRGKQVKVPAETVLTFRLDQPLSLQPAQ